MIDSCNGIYGMQMPLLSVNSYCQERLVVNLLSEWGSGGRLLLWSGRTEEAVNRVLQSAETIRLDKVPPPPP